MDRDSQSPQEAKPAPSFAYIRDLNPQIDDIPEILRIIKRHEGDNDAIARGIYRLFKRAKRRKGFTLHSIHANTMSSLRDNNLGVMTEDGHLTPFGKTLLASAGDLGQLKKLIAKHLILQKGGWQFCRGLQSVARPNQGGYRAALANFLAEKFGIEFWRDHNNISSMHNFLEWAGVCSDYVLNEKKLREIIELDETTLKGAEGLSPEAIVLLEALIRSGGSLPPGAVRERAEGIRGRKIDPHSLPGYGKELEKRGLIELPGKRGSKTRPWRLKDREAAEIVAQLVSSLSKIRPIPDEAFREPFKALLQRVETGNKDQKGRALENLAARISWMLGLQNVEIRLLGEYEVDVRADSRAPIYQKWIMQCKATHATVGPSTLLREYGIAKLENIPVIVLLATANISPRTRTIADKIMATSNKTVILLGRDDLRAIGENENQLFEILKRQSEHARAVKVPQKEAEVTEELAMEREEEGDSESEPG